MRTPRRTHADAGAEDAALIGRCVAGDGRAWKALVRRHQRLVYAITQRVGLDDRAAADVFQTVFERSMWHLPRTGEPNRLQAWIATTARREALLHRTRSRRALSMTPADDASGKSHKWELADETPNAEEALQQLQQVAELRNAVDRLDLRCRKMLLGFRDAGDPLTYDQMARRLGTSAGSIGPTRSRCLDKLRSYIR